MSSSNLLSKLGLDSLQGLNLSIYSIAVDTTTNVTLTLYIIQYNTVAGDCVSMPFHASTSARQRVRISSLVWQFGRLFYLNTVFN